MLISIDFQKAFYSVSHSFIFKTLKQFKFGVSLQKWVNVFYNDSQSSVQINGFISEAFKIEGGSRQGDGLSPYLFLLCMEVFGMMVRQNKYLKGIVVNNKYKLSQYADNNIFTDGSEKSMYELFSILNKFSSLSGLNINVEKNKCGMDKILQTQS